MKSLFFTLHYLIFIIYSPSIISFSFLGDESKVKTRPNNEETNLNMNRELMKRIIDQGPGAEIHDRSHPSFSFRQ